MSNNYIRCPKCKGQKVYTGLGMVAHRCDKCVATGKILKESLTDNELALALGVKTESTLQADEPSFPNSDLAGESVMFEDSPPIDTKAIQEKYNGEYERRRHAGDQKFLSQQKLTPAQQLAQQQRTTSHNTDAVTQAAYNSEYEAKKNLAIQRANSSGRGRPRKV